MSLADAQAEGWFAPASSGSAAGSPAGVTGLGSAGGGQRDGLGTFDGGPSKAGPAALEVRGVTVRFGGVAALTSVSLEAASGSVTGLIGPNGAGKTTLFNVISGLQRPDRGQVFLADHPVTNLGPHRRSRLGLARTFQRLELFTSLSAVENVRVGLDAAGRRPGKAAISGSPGSQGGPEAVGVSPASTSSDAALAPPTRPRGGRAEAEALLERVGAGHTAHQLVGALPTGSARLVELARALAINPKVLLLDEPCSGLDEGESVALGRLLGDLAREGRAIVLVEHDMDLVLRICDQVHVLDFGEVIASGPPTAIRNDPAVQAAYLGTTDPPKEPGDQLSGDELSGDDEPGDDVKGAAT